MSAISNKQIAVLTDEELHDSITETALVAKSHYTNAVMTAHRCGLLLLEMRARCKKGTWVKWLDEHWDHSERLAQSYMQLAGAEKPLIKDCESIRSALEKLTKPDPQRAAPTAPSKPPVEPHKPAEPADDFADLEPATTIAKREAVTIDQDSQKTLVREWVAAFADIENKLTAAKSIVELLTLHDLSLLALVVESAIETKSKGVAA